MILGTVKHAGMTDRHSAHDPCFIEVYAQNQNDLTRIAEKTGFDLEFTESGSNKYVVSGTLEAVTQFISQYVNSGSYRNFADMPNFIKQRFYDEVVFGKYPGLEKLGKSKLPPAIRSNMDKLVVMEYFIRHFDKLMKKAASEYDFGNKSEDEIKDTLRYVRAGRQHLARGAAYDLGICMEKDFIEDIKRDIHANEHAFRFGPQRIQEAIAYWQKRLDEMEAVSAKLPENPQTDEEFDQVVAYFSENFDDLLEKAAGRYKSHDFDKYYGEAVLEDMADDKDQLIQDAVADDVVTEDMFVEYLLGQISGYDESYVYNHPEYFDEDGNWDTAEQRRRDYDDYMADRWDEGRYED